MYGDRHAGDGVVLQSDDWDIANRYENDDLNLIVGGLRNKFQTDDDECFDYRNVFSERLRRVRCRRFRYCEIQVGNSEMNRILKLISFDHDDLQVVACHVRFQKSRRVHENLSVLRRLSSRQSMEITLVAGLRKSTMDIVPDVVDCKNKTSTNAKETSRKTDTHISDNIKRFAD